MARNLTGGTTALFVIALSVAVSEPIDVKWKTKDGTAKAGTDYDAATGTVTFLPGETEKQISVTVYGRDESAGESNKTFYIEVDPPVNAILGTALVDCTITVTDEDGTPVTTVMVAQGRRGPQGVPGRSAYEQAVIMGYEGTVEEWMAEIGDAAAAAQRAEAAATTAATEANSLIEPNVTAAQAAATASQESANAAAGSVTAAQNVVNSAYATTGKAFATLALAQAATGSLTANSEVKVLQDPTASNNGSWVWNGSTLTKSTYSPISQEKSLYIVVNTLSELQAIVPSNNSYMARVNETGDEYRWNPALTTTVKWELTGRNFLSESKAYTDEKTLNKIEKIQGILSGAFLALTDNNGNQTWMQARKSDGSLTDYARDRIYERLLPLLLSLITENTFIHEQAITPPSILFSITDASGNQTALTVRKSDGMFVDFVIENIQSRLDLSSVAVSQDFQVKAKPCDFQILSSIARGIVRHTNNVALPANPFNFTNSLAQDSRLTFPSNYNDGTPIILAIQFGGVSDQNLTPISQYLNLLENGVVWGRSKFHGDSYGSPNCMQDALELYRKACEIAPIAGVILVGNSMGGIAAQNALLTNTIPNVIGLYLTDPTYNLRQRYDSASARATTIKEAYGIASDGSDYSEKTAGYDPALHHWTHYKGVPVRIVASSLDPTVPFSLHTQKLYEKLVGHNDITVLDKQSSGHNNGDRFDGTDLLAFITKCASGAVILN